MLPFERALLTLVASGGLLVSLGAAETLALGAAARAETVEARRSSPVFSSPGEQSRVVTRVRSGMELRVLQRRHRWLRVRVNGRTGWITRTSVVALELIDLPERRTRRRGFVEGRGPRRRSRGAGPRDRIGADAIGQDDVANRELAQRRRGASRPAPDDDLDDDLDVGIDPEDVEDEEAEEIAAPRTAVRRIAAPRAAAPRPSAARADAPGLAIQVDEDDVDVDEDDVDEDEEDDEPVPPARSRREIVVVKGPSARLRAQPTTRSALVDRAPSGAELHVLERSGKWVKVESQTGKTGWVRRTKVQSPVPARVAEKLARRASAGLGYSAIAQDFASTSDDPRGVYSLSSGAAVLGLAGEIVHDHDASWLLAGDLTYRYAQATPGIRYTDPETLASADIGFKRHQVDLGARAGYKLGGEMAMAIHGRLGFHYDDFRIDDVNDFDRNLARLPSEVLSGVTVGALLDVPRLGDGWSARLELETLPLLAARKQTSGLEDGAASDVFAIWGGAHVDYAWNETYKVTGEYQYAHARTAWRGLKEGSMRPHQADAARRKDSTHVLLIGIGRSF